MNRSLKDGLDLPARGVGGADVEEDEGFAAENGRNADEDEGEKAMDEVGRDEVRVGGDGPGDDEKEEEEVVEQVLGVGEGKEDGAEDGDRQEYVASRGDEAVISSRALGRLSRA